MDYGFVLGTPLPLDIQFPEYRCPLTPAAGASLQGPVDLRAFSRLAAISFGNAGTRLTFFVIAAPLYTRASPERAPLTGPPLRPFGAFVAVVMKQDH